MRRLLVLVSAVVFVDAMLFGVLSPLVPGYAQQFGLSKASVGILVAAFGTGALVGGLPGGFAAMWLGPKRTVLLGLALLSAASLGFALAGDPWALGLARFVQGVSSTTTWAGALAWLAVAAPPGRRGETLGVAFGTAVFGTLLGPMLGATAHELGVRATFLVVAAVALVFLAATAVSAAAPVERPRPGALRRAMRDRSFVGGLWLNTLPASLFGTISLLVPLALDRGGFTPFAIGAVFVASGLIETLINPVLGRVSDQIGRLRPTQVALAASIVVAVALGFVTHPLAIAALVCASALSFGSFYTPAMALVSDRAEAAGLSQGLAFGVMNSAWALGNLAGPAGGGLLAERWGDATPYLIGAVLCLATLLATRHWARTRTSPALPTADQPTAGQPVI